MGWNGFAGLRRDPEWIPSAAKEFVMSRTLTTLQDRVATAIRCNSHLAGRRLIVAAERGRVVLTGIVSSYYQKQLAQETVWGVEGVSAVENQLEVSWQPPRRAK
jgi:osmotically-inducible protein OsmY